MDFDADSLACFIRESAGGMQISEIDDKTQIQYLHKYLGNKQHTRAKTIIVESHYVDRHYLEDFSEYYARCFNEYPRSCSRIHFFSSKFDHPEFLEHLSANNQEFIEKLQNSYLGFLVVRPIPHTFLGRLCLRPYKELVESESYKIIQPKNSVSLFGIDLTISGSLFVEKDHVVARCATSAIWSLLSSSSELNISPSLSSITKSAGAITEGGRTFPTERLTPQQITRSLRHFGLESSVHNLEASDSMCEARELAYAYLSNDTPILIGGTVYAKCGAELKSKGPHLVCAFGYRLDGSQNQVGDLRLGSHRVDRIYVHDDRYGPYVSWRETQIDIEGKMVSVWEYGLKDENDSLVASHEEYFSPDIVILGTNHKVRIPYLEIYNSCLAFSAHIQADMLRLVEQSSEKWAYYINAIQVALDSNWSISLIGSTSYKTWIRNAKDFIFFNGVADKNAILLKSLPKHLWLCRIENDDGLFMDILFDATEVPQGNFLVGFTVYSESADSVVRLAEAFVRQRDWAYYEFDDDSKVNIRPFVTFFNERPDRHSLNSKYGPLGTPFRGLTMSERDETKNITQANARTISAHSGDVDWEQILDKTEKQIWVVDEQGNLVLGVEDEDDKHGHPTLIDGRPARIGGELIYDDVRHVWTVNLYSRAYSQHIKVPSDAANFYLDNVIDNLLSGLEAKPDYGTPGFERDRSE